VTDIALQEGEQLKGSGPVAAGVEQGLAGAATPR
jgi:hypothetical protein